MCMKFSDSAGGPHEKRLLNNLLGTYNTLERPVANESEALEVKFGLTLQQIIDVVSWNMILIFQSCMATISNNKKNNSVRKNSAKLIDRQRRYKREYFSYGIMQKEKGKISNLYYNWTFSRVAIIHVYTSSRAYRVSSKARVFIWYFSSRLSFFHASFCYSEKEQN